jgi:hypothetical protein
MLYEPNSFQEALTTLTSTFDAAVADHAQRFVAAHLDPETQPQYEASATVLYDVNRDMTKLHGRIAAAIEQARAEASTVIGTVQRETRRHQTLERAARHMEDAKEGSSVYYNDANSTRHASRVEMAEITLGVVLMLAALVRQR